MQRLDSIGTNQRTHWESTDGSSYAEQKNKIGAETKIEWIETWIIWMKEKTTVKAKHYM